MTAAEIGATLRVKVLPKEDGIHLRSSERTPFYPGHYDITEMCQGTTFILSLMWEDEQSALIDVSAYTARMKIKQHHDSTTTIATLVSGTEITLAAAAPNIKITIAATATDDYTFVQAVYDLELVTGTTVYRLLEGAICLRKEVTTT